MTPCKEDHFPDPSFVGKDASDNTQNVWKDEKPAKTSQKTSKNLVFFSLAARGEVLRTWQ